MKRTVSAAVILAGLAVAAAWQWSASAEAAQSQAQRATMLDMTFPEFEAAVKKSDVVLLPIGAIEEHGPSLPLDTDAVIATGQFLEVQRYLRTKGVETIVGPALNIGLTSEVGDFGRNGTFIYPGSLTVRVDTFVALYVDVLRALRASGVGRVFLFSGHGGGAQQRAVIQIADEASKAIEGMKVYALVSSENVARIGLTATSSVVLLQNFRNFELLGKMLGTGTEPPATTHADGAETSLMLFFRPESVRRGFQKVPQSPSSAFFAAVNSGDRAKNPSGMGGFPMTKASASVGKSLLDYRTTLMGDAIARVLAQPSPAVGDQKRSYAFPGTGEMIPYHVFVPSTWRPGRQLPMVVALHGNGAAPESLFERGGGVLARLAEDRGIIVVAPTGYVANGGYNNRFAIVPAPRPAGAGPRSSPPPDITPRPAPRLPLTDTDRERSEQDVLQVADLVAKEYGVDPARVYLFGTSAGGGGAWHLAQKYPKRWKALVVSAAPVTPESYPFEHLAGLPVLVVHGDRDDATSFDASAVMVRHAKGLGLEFGFLPVPGGDHFEAWASVAPQIFAFFEQHGARQ